MVVYPCDNYEVSNYQLLTGMKGQLKEEIPSVAMMTNFGFGPVLTVIHMCLQYLQRDHMKK